MLKVVLFGFLMSNPSVEDLRSFIDKCNQLNGELQYVDTGNDVMLQCYRYEDDDKDA